MARSDIRPSARRPTTREQWATALTSIEPNRILIRGYRLDELMGRANFSETIYLLLTGELPTPSISRLIDVMLVSFLDHGVTPPSTLATRNAATTGASLRSSVAAGLLGFGRHYGADALACRQILDDGLGRMRRGTGVEAAAAAIVSGLVTQGDVPPPGFGHRYHTADPRALRLLQVAHELEVDDEYTRLLRALERALAAHPDLTGLSLPVNIDGAIAAVCGDVGLPPSVADALLVISRVPGLAAHALEEVERHHPMRVIDPTAHSYDGASERRLPPRRQ